MTDPTENGPEKAPVDIQDIEQRGAAASKAKEAAEHAFDEVWEEMIEAWRTILSQGGVSGGDFRASWERAGFSMCPGERDMGITDAACLLGVCRDALYRDSEKSMPHSHCGLVGCKGAKEVEPNDEGNLALTFTYTTDKGRKWRIEPSKDPGFWDAWDESDTNAMRVGLEVYQLPTVAGEQWSASFSSWSRDEHRLVFAPTQEKVLECALRHITDDFDDYEATKASATLTDGTLIDLVGGDGELRGMKSAPDPMVLDSDAELAAGYTEPLKHAFGTADHDPHRILTRAQVKEAVARYAESVCDDMGKILTKDEHDAFVSEVRGLIAKQAADHQRPRNGKLWVQNVKIPSLRSPGTWGADAGNFGMGADGTWHITSDDASAGWRLLTESEAREHEASEVREKFDQAMNDLRCEMQSAKDDLTRAFAGVPARADEEADERAAIVENAERTERVVAAVKAKMDEGRVCLATTPNPDGPLSSSTPWLGSSITSQTAILTKWSKRIAWDAEPTIEITPEAAAAIAESLKRPDPNPPGAGE